MDYSNPLRKAEQLFFNIWSFAAAKLSSSDNFSFKTNTGKSAKEATWNDELIGADGLLPDLSTF